MHIHWPQLHHAREGETAEPCAQIKIFVPIPRTRGIILERCESPLRRRMFLFEWAMAKQSDVHDPKPDDSPRLHAALNRNGTERHKLEGVEHGARCLFAITNNIFQP
jgi:hypothetical protein